RLLPEIAVGGAVALGAHDERLALGVPGDRAAEVLPDRLPEERRLAGTLGVGGDRIGHGEDGATMGRGRRRFPLCSPRMSDADEALVRQGAILVKWGFERYRAAFRRITRT